MKNGVKYSVEAAFKLIAQTAWGNLKSQTVTHSAVGVDGACHQDTIDAFRLGVGVLVVRRTSTLAGVDAPRVTVNLMNKALVTSGS